MRSLLVALTCLCLVFGYMVSAVESQRKAALAVLTSGGSIEYFEDRDSREPNSMRVYTIARATDYSFARDFGKRIAMAACGPESTDESCSLLARVPSIEELYLGGKVTDAGVGHLRPLKALKKVCLHGPNFSNDAVKVLLELPNVEVLTLDNTSITDDGIGYLSWMTNLKELYLFDLTTTRGVAEQLQTALPDCHVHLTYLPRAQSLSGATRFGDFGR